MRKNKLKQKQKPSKRIRYSKNNRNRSQSITFLNYCNHSTSIKSKTFLFDSLPSLLHKSPKMSTNSKTSIKKPKIKSNSKSMVISSNFYNKYSPHLSMMPCLKKYKNKSPRQENLSKKSSTNKSSISIWWFFKKKSNKKTSKNPFYNNNLDQWIPLRRQVWNF